MSGMLATGTEYVQTFLRIIIHPISSGAWLLGGITRAVRQITQNTVGIMIRDNMVFPDP